MCPRERHLAVTRGQRLVDVISRVDGVGEVQSFGSGYAMRIWLDPGKLQKYALMPSDITAALTAQNTQVSAGQLGALPAAAGQRLNATISARSKLKTVDEFKHVVVKSASDGTIVRLADVARVELGNESYSVQMHYDGKASAAMGIKLATGANALSVATAVKASVTRALPFDVLDEDIDCRRSSPFIFCSMICVTESSTILAEAPV
jgi:multidrug efflux pump subunit AcrB